MSKERKLACSLVVVATLAVVAMMTTSVVARGGHGGGGHGGGAHHQPHPYHPSQHHAEHHAAHHDAHRGEHHDHHVAHHNHHHHSWHHGGWGPGFWGGAALGYGYNGWGGWGYDDGDTYVDNSTNVMPVSNESSDADDSSDDSADASADASDNQNNAASPNNSGNFPVDDWPELGVVTYAGQYGGAQGQVVVRVVPNSSAAKASFVPGDVILSLNGQPTPSADALDTVLDTANGEFEADVWDARTGRKSTLSGQLDPNAPAANETAATEPQPR